MSNFVTLASGSAQAITTPIASSASNSSFQTTILPQLFAAQYTRLLSLLNSPPSPQPTVNFLTISLSPATGMCLSLSSSSIASWIIDSGATDHLYCSLNLFSSYHSIRPLYVHLPTGSCAIACLSGTVRISDSLVLENMLYLSSFSLNILSVSRLTSSINCSITFSVDSCQILSTPPLRMIGSARIVEGLYILPAIAPSASSSHINFTNNSSVSTHPLWHL